jgi:glucosamine--fructose-6-phosphate aminotransferase (isomerizing)
MCGIVGYVGARPASEILLAGLGELEYRGYDSAGIALQTPAGPIESVRAVGNLAALRARVQAGEDARPRDGGTRALALVDAPPTTGIGHTRWATHGRVTEANAHPHDDTAGRVHVVVNGIVENYVALQRELQAAGARFSSETDAEVIAHLIARHHDGDAVQAVRAAYRRLRGHFAFVAMSADDPGLLVGARQECPLVVGRGDGEQFVASAVPAFLAHTREVQWVEDGEVVALHHDGVDFSDVDGVPIERVVSHIDWDHAAAEKGGYETFMLKEIHEQADAIAETVGDRAGPTEIDLGAAGGDFLAGVRRILIFACGSSYHAGQIARYAIEEWSRVPVGVDIASEGRYRNPVLGPDDLVIGITQSGETRDTLAAMRLGRQRGARVLAITNVMGSTATREADAVLFTRAGREISVAATKTFIAQTVALHLLGLRLAQMHGALSAERLAALVSDLRALPEHVEALLAAVDEPVARIADAVRRAPFFLYLGRHVGLPVALEGALKLKEISYVNADAYAAGEMKHGPIALLDESTPVVCVATDSPVLEKMVSNMQEVRARGAMVIAIASEGNTEIVRHADHVIYVPATDWILAPILAVIPLQLLAYRIARLRGLNVDQPRNLAKTVTVE